MLNIYIWTEEDDMSVSKGNWNDNVMILASNEQNKYTYVLEKLAMNKQIEGISSVGIVVIVTWNRCCIEDDEVVLNNNPNNNEPANRYMVNKLDGESVRDASPPSTGTLSLCTCCVPLNWLNVVTSFGGMLFGFLFRESDGQ